WSQEPIERHPGTVYSLRKILHLVRSAGDSDTDGDFFLDQAPSFAWPFAKTRRIKNSRSARAAKHDRCRITAQSSCAWRKAYALLLLFHRNEVVVRIAADQFVVGVDPDKRRFRVND